jgi:hypothetical protein
MKDFELATPELAALNNEILVQIPFITNEN